MKAPVQKLVRVEGIDLKLAGQIKSGGNRTEVEKQLDLIGQSGTKVITIWDKEYPRQLKQIPDPPVLLFYQGQLKPQHQKSISVVGTRTPSNYGKMVAEELVKELVANGITIVSGLARGIDAVAHHTAIQSGGETLAVLGNGVDRLYPMDNRQLYQDIPQHGAILSEYFLGTGPDAVNFPKRNRIISGLSLGCLVVEAGDRSGALITAFYALNHNREVFAIPGNINSQRSRGANRLIKQGAKLVQNVNDILEEIGELSIPVSGQPRPVPDHLSAMEKKVLLALSDEPKHIDRLVIDLRESPATILSSLLTLELLGVARQLPGKMFIRI